MVSGRNHIRLILNRCVPALAHIIDAGPYKLSHINITIIADNFQTVLTVWRKTSVSITAAAKHTCRHIPADNDFFTAVVRPTCGMHKAGLSLHGCQIRKMCANIFIRLFHTILCAENSTNALQILCSIDPLIPIFLFRCFHTAAEYIRCLYDDMIRILLQRPLSQTDHLCINPKRRIWFKFCTVKLCHPFIGCPFRHLIDIPQFVYRRPHDNTRMVAMSSDHLLNVLIAPAIWRFFQGSVCRKCYFRQASVTCAGPVCRHLI